MISCRAITHTAQVDTRTTQIIQDVIISFFAQLDRSIMFYDKCSILNMDETPFISTWFALSLKSGTNQSMSTLQAMTRCDLHSFLITRRLGCACHLMSCLGIEFVLILFDESVCFERNLLKAPKCVNEHNIVTMGSKSGTMDHVLVVDYLKPIVFSYAQSIGKKLLLLWDAHESHWQEDVISLVKENDHELNGIPPRTTSYLQQLDVSINAPFKNAARDYYEQWISQDDLPLTQHGNIKRASYDCVLDWVSKSIAEVDSMTIEK